MGIVFSIFIDRRDRQTVEDRTAALGNTHGRLFASCTPRTHLTSLSSYLLSFYTSTHCYHSLLSPTFGTLFFLILILCFFPPGRLADKTVTSATLPPLPPAPAHRLPHYHLHSTPRAFPSPLPPPTACTRQLPFIHLTCFKTALPCHTFIYARCVYYTTFTCRFPTIHTGTPRRCAAFWWA